MTCFQYLLIQDVYLHYSPVGENINRNFEFIQLVPLEVIAHKTHSVFLLLE
jgi:hypothetical protein